ncbi:Cytosolic 5'-nucleotidase 3 [Vitis vinifera]|uniref:5'-nucleotidase n=1 Tax=Vitis vinifera TaxID=29760 RepID=A0A438H3F4_VITVI|nr:Cytosolic 5'-nucleotidase 3 [Vitis vinifera]
MSYLPRSSSGSSVIISSIIIKPVRFPRVWCCTHTPINQTQTAMEQLDPSKSSQVVVPHPHLLHAKISSIRMAGHSKLQIIADFDATLTKYWVNGCRGQSSHGLLQQGNPEYDVKRRELYDYYHPLEISPSIPIEEKAKLMEEWWGKTHALLIEGGLTYDAITKSVANSMITFREGVVELFEFLEARDIPVLIFSAGLADVIEEVLRQKLHRSFKNIKIVSNRMIFDGDGHLVSFKGILLIAMFLVRSSFESGPIQTCPSSILFVASWVILTPGKTIHVLNKNEHALDMAGPLHDELGDSDGPNEDSASVKKRTNVLLLGDHIGDLGMSDGLDYETRISVGFL